MNEQDFATHLGFSTWEQLMEASSLVATDDERTWYITQTRTWYKWVLWNTNYDLFFNHTTREAALSTLKSLFEKSRITHFQWNDPTDFDSISACFYGTPNMSMSLSTTWPWEWDQLT